VKVEEIRLEGDKTMKLQDPITSAQTMSRSILRLNVAEESRNNGPSLAEIRERAFEIHIERGGIHGCDLDDWLQAERELQEKYNKRKDGGRRRNDAHINTTVLRSQRLFSLTSSEENSMLKISFSETPAEERWILHGLLTDPWVQEFRACWQKNHRTEVRRACIVDSTKSHSSTSVVNNSCAYWPKKERSSLPAGPIPNTLLST